MKRTVGILFLIAVSYELSVVSCLYAAGVGTSGAAFLKVGVGARPLAMGNAYTAVTDDADSINWNPGALTELKEQNVTASYSSLFLDQSQGFMAYAAPLKDKMGSVGFGVNYMIVSDIEKRAGDTETPESTFSNQNFAVSFSYARPELFQGLSLGGNVKYIREKLDSFSGNAVALDTGALYRPSVENLTLGAACENLGTKIGPDPLPLNLRGGAAYKLLDGNLTLASDVEWLIQDKRAYLDFGVEYTIYKVFSARAGYQFGHGNDKLGGIVGLGAGAGIRYNRFNLDYAFVPFGDLGDTHRITLGARF